VFVCTLSAPLYLLSLFFIWTVLSEINDLIDIKSYVLYRMVPLSMTFSDRPNSIVSRSQYRKQFKGEYFANGASDPSMFGSRLGTCFRGRRIEWRYFRFDQIQTRVGWENMVCSSFMHQYLENGTRYDQSYQVECALSIGTKVDDLG